MKLLLVLLISLPVFGQNPVLPDAPEPQSPKPVTFWTFRKSWQAPPIRGNRQVLRSKIFWIGAGAHLASVIVACRNPRSGEKWDSELPAFFGVQGLNYLSMRYLAAWYVLPADAYATEHYIRSALK
jgi:hypothetical protein